MMGIMKKKGNKCNAFQKTEKYVRRSLGRFSFAVFTLCATVSVRFRIRYINEFVFKILRKDFLWVFFLLYIHFAAFCIAYGMHVRCNYWMSSCCFFLYLGVVSTFVYYVLYNTIRICIFVFFFLLRVALAIFKYFSLLSASSFFSKYFFYSIHNYLILFRIYIESRRVNVYAYAHWALCRARHNICVYVNNTTAMKWVWKWTLFIKKFLILFDSDPLL